MQYGKTRHRAFTLIETIAAIVVLSIGVPPILYAVREAHVARVNPALVAKARWLAVERMEDVIADRYAPARGYDWVVAARYQAESPVTGFGQFTRTVAVLETGPDLATPGSGYKLVTISVSWSDARGVTQSFDVTSVLTEYDL
ncbi:MAG: type IV pilus modification PilV family protein [Phycisphaerales bacterium]